MAICTVAILVFNRRDFIAQAIRSARWRDVNLVAMRRSVGPGVCGSIGLRNLP
jgi:hypothetical protein